MFTRVWATGLGYREIAGSAELTQLDINASRALDATGGGAYSPSNIIQIGGAGFKVHDAPFILDGSTGTATILVPVTWGGYDVAIGSTGASCGWWTFTGYTVGSGGIKLKQGAMLKAEGSGRVKAKRPHVSSSGNQTFSIGDGDSFKAAYTGSSYTWRFQNTGAEDGDEVEIVCAPTGSTGKILSIQDDEPATIAELDFGSGTFGSGTRFSCIIGHDGANWYLKHVSEK